MLRYFHASFGRFVGHLWQRWRLVGACSFVALLFLLPIHAGSAERSSQEPSGPAVDTSPNLNVTPKRLALNRGERSATFYIFNQGSAPATFDISTVDRIMVPNGEIVPVSEAATNPALAPVVAKLKSAHGMITAVPRRAILLPGKGQTIRIRVTAPPKGDAAEYRTHLTVMTVPPRSIGLTAEQAAAAEQSDQVSFQIATVFGVSIPVIVRSGPADIRANISNARFGQGPNGTATLAFDVHRLGANSIFGNVEARIKGEKTPIGIARGVGVYPEIDKRSFQLALSRLPRRGEQLEILYIDDDTSPGRTLARTTIVAP